MYNNKDLNIEELKDNIIYDETSGIFIWSIPQKGRPTDQTAGGINAQGYHIITFQGIKILGSHLAWFFMTGDWPTEDVGYKDGNRRNLKWDNLYYISKDEKQHAFREREKEINKPQVSTKPVKAARFSNKEVHEAVEQFIKNKVLVDGRYSQI